MPISVRNKSLRDAGVFLSFALLSNVASAGPLVDWLLNYRTANQAQPVVANYPMAVSTGPYTSTNPYVAQQVNPSPYAVTPYSPTQNATVMPSYNWQTSATPYSAEYVPIPQTTLGFLPTGSYQTTLNNVPTTYYRPVTTLDPNTGTTVTTLQPCTSYQQQVLRTPTLNPSSSYYAAYGGYGAGSTQDRFSPITGNSIAASSGQSTLSIASDGNLKSFAPTNTIPVTGVPVPYSTTINAGYFPLSTANNYSTALQGVAPASALSTGTTYSAGYPSVPAPSAVQGQSYVQADGSIVTPLGSYTTLAPTIPAANNSTFATPNTMAPQANVGTSQSSQMQFTPETSLRPMPATNPTSTLPSSNYSPSNAYAPVLPEPSVLPSQSVLPSGSSFNSGNPALDQGYLNSTPSATAPANNGYAPAMSLEDPASIVPPSLLPMSNYEPTNHEPSTRDNATRVPQLGRMVPIDRPTTQFAHAPQREDELPTTSAFVRDQQVLPYDRATDTRFSPSGAIAPKLLEPSIQGEEPIQGIRPPEGFEPKPYWRSEQQSAEPNALFNTDEKTASRTQDVARQSQSSPVQSNVEASRVEFISSQRFAPVASQSASEASSPSTRAMPLKRQPLSGQRLPSTSAPLNDGFEPVK